MTATLADTSHFDNQKPASLLVVNISRIEHARVAKFELHGAAFLPKRHRAVKTGAATRVAGAGHLLDLDPDGILVAIDPKLDDPLGVTRGPTLAPQRPARAAEVPGF